jgi:esterase/lipase
MSRLLAGLVILAVVIGMAAPVSAQTIGVVLMHGNTDSPDGTIAPLAAALEGAGYLVERPEMCWSYRRRRDRPVLDCLAELEAPIGRLTGRGACAIALAGMSVGGVAAVAFGARRSVWPASSRSPQTERRSGWYASFPRSRRASLRHGRWSPPAAAMNAPASPT